MNMLNIINKDKSTVDITISNIIYKVLNIIFKFKSMIDFVYKLYNIYFNFPILII